MPESQSVLEHITATRSSTCEQNERMVTVSDCLGRLLGFPGVVPA